MIKGWLKSMPPESLKPQGAGPGRTTFWGMVPPGTAFLGRGRSECPRAEQPTLLLGQCPCRTAALELYPRSRVTSLASPPPRLLPPRRAPTLEERDAPDPREFTDAHRTGAASQTSGAEAEGGFGLQLPSLSLFLTSLLEYNCFTRVC